LKRKKTTYKEVTENCVVENLKSESKSKLPRRQKISKWVEKVWRDRCPTLVFMVLQFFSTVLYWQ